jgi:O-antigen/teichoic acid export membrane protein
MSGMKTLAGDTLIYGASTIVTRMLGYLMVPYLTRVMGTGEYGVYTDVYSLIPFALVVLTMGLESGYFRFAGKAESEQQKAKIFSTLFTAIGVAVLIFSLFVTPFAAAFAPEMGYQDPWVVRVMCWIVGLDALTALPFARLREQRRRMKYVAIRFATVVVNLVLCVMFYTAMGRTGVAPALWANLAASGVALAMLAPTVWKIRDRFDRQIFRTVTVYSLPLLISGVAGTAGEFIDRQMIKWLMPEEVAMSELGVYGATAKLAVIMVLFTQTYRFAAEPFFLSRFAKGDFERQTRLAMRLYILVAVLIFAGVMIFKPLIMQIIGEDFREGERLLPILLAANALAGVWLNLSWWYKQQGRTWVAIVITGTGLVVAVALNVALIPRLGYEGAAWARLACEGAMVVVSFVLMRRARRRGGEVVV